MKMNLHLADKTEKREVYDDVVQVDSLSLTRPHLHATI